MSGKSGKKKMEKMNDPFCYGNGIVLIHEIDIIFHSIFDRKRTTLSWDMN